MSAPVPHAVGTLESTPFGELLVQALDHRLTGTLVLEESSGARHGIYLVGGKPRKARVATPVGFLGQVLVEAGVISPSVHELMLARALREHVLYGQLLLGSGLIDEHALGLGLKEQLSRQLVWLFAQPLDTQYGYFDGSNFLANWGAPAGADPSTLEILWRGLREHARPREIEGALRRVAGLKIELRQDLPRDHFTFLGDDQRIVALLAEGPRRMTELIDAAPLMEAAIQRVLYFLVLTRSVNLGLPSAPPVGLDTEPFVAPASPPLPSFGRGIPPVVSPSATPVPSVPAPSASPPVSVRRDSPSSSTPPAARSASLREELRRRSEHPPKSHYETLGVSADATLRQVQSAFFLLSKHWHPDRLGPEVADLRGGATRVFEAISQAYRTLSDPAARTVYDAELASGTSPDTTPALERALSADVAFQKAESFLARGNLEAAGREAKLALEHEPKRSEHIALHAWLSSLKPDADERRIAADLARAVRAADGSMKVHWYRGLFLKRVGRHSAALQEFRLVCERDSRHIDAAREVRLYEQRLRNSPKDRPSLAPEPPPPPSSAWSRLFKRRT